jgi:uncharacterized protein (DUF433 family)
MRHERIIRDPDIVGGEPVVKGTRISVELVLARLALNPDVADLLEGYPRLSVADVKACLAYARDIVAGEDVSFGELTVTASASA